MYYQNIDIVDTTSYISILEGKVAGGGHIHCGGGVQRVQADKDEAQQDLQDVLEHEGSVEKARVPVK